MPIYEYRCENCKHELEAIQKMSDAPLSTCPACEQEALKKRVSAAAFRLKGGGWYETDFKSGNKKNIAAADKADGSSKGSADNSSAKASDSKPAKSEESKKSAPAKTSDSSS